MRKERGVPQNQRPHENQRNHKPLLPQPFCRSEMRWKAMVAVVFLKKFCEVKSQIGKETKIPQGTTTPSKVLDVSGKPPGVAEELRYEQIKKQQATNISTEV